MRGIISAYSPAKVNLHLDVGAVGEGGYHQVLSLVQMVELCDSIVVRELPSQRNKIIIEGPFSFPQKENLIYKAVCAFRERVTYDTDIVIEVTKRIPERGGLGGGSSNAATMLKILSLLTGDPLSKEDKSAMAISLGSDVPFFLCETASAFVSGQGEEVQAIPSERLHQLLIVQPPFGIETRWAFATLDEQRGDRTFPPLLSKEEIIRSYVEGDPLNWPFSNSFFPMLKKRYPRLLTIEEDLRRLGAAFVTLSGSGGALVGLFTDHERYDKACHAFHKGSYTCYRLSSLDCFPPIVLG